MFGSFFLVKSHYLSCLKAHHFGEQQRMEVQRQRETRNPIVELPQEMPEAGIRNSPVRGT
jgi:hypothetical protein